MKINNLIILTSNFYFQQHLHLIILRPNKKRVCFNKMKSARVRDYTAD